MTYNNALKLIAQKQSLGIKPGLERINALLKKMGNPQNKFKIIHIAGTNGKGTVSATIADCLKNAGFKTGLFTSPWVVDYTEQIQINGEFIPQGVLADYISQYKDEDATEFELVTAIMYKYFADNAVDYAVVECGMGGKGDATNVESFNLSVITAVSVDHTDFLGSDIFQIACEKSGIIRKNSTCVLYPNPLCEDVFINACKKLDAKIVPVKDNGDYKINNLNTVNAVLKELGISKQFFAEKTVCLPARCEKINGVIIDGGHNIQSALALENTLKSRSGEVAVIGMMKDKDIDGYLSVIAPYCKMIVATTPDNPRALHAKELAKKAAEYCSRVVAVDNPSDAVALAKQHGLTLVCGSFFLARQIRKDFM